MRACVRAHALAGVRTSEREACRGPVDLQSCLVDTVRAALNAHLGVLPCTVRLNTSAPLRQEAHEIMALLTIDAGDCSPHLNLSLEEPAPNRPHHVDDAPG